MPVLPLVESRRILSGVRAPERSPAWIMLSAGRSLTEPPGLKYSALAWISMPGGPTAIRLRRRSGVLPTLPITVSADFADARVVLIFLNLDYLYCTIGGFTDMQFRCMKLHESVS